MFAAFAQRPIAMGKKNKKEETKSGPPSIDNKKARRNYEILDTFEAGIVLVGTEVKSLRAGQANISEAYAVPQNGEMFLLNAHISPYPNGGAFNHEETRTRKLLLKKAQIDKLNSRVREKRLSVVPLKMYFNERGKVKLLLGVGRGKKLADKRETEKKNEAQRDIARSLREAGH